MTYKCNHCDNIACAGRSWDDGCYHTTPDAIKKRKDANTHGCKEFVKHPQPFNPVSFVTLYHNRLFTAEEVCDIIASHAPAKSEQRASLKDDVKFNDRRFWLTGKQMTDILYSVVGISPFQSKDPDDMKEYPIPDGEKILKFIRDNQREG